MADKSKTYKLVYYVDITINTMTILCVICAWNSASVMAAVIIASCFCSFAFNIIQAFLNKPLVKASNSPLFGIENVLYLIMIIILIGSENNMTYSIIAVAVGTFALYKSALILINHKWITPLLYQSDFSRSVQKIHGYDVLIGLIAIIVLSSNLFPHIEEGIPTFQDSIWYCFMLISTIGFGDLYASTFVGRFLSVIIGLYGIIIVAIMTSTIACYLNEKSDKEAAEKAKEEAEAKKKKKSK